MALYAVVGFDELHWFKASFYRRCGVAVTVLGFTVSLMWRSTATMLDTIVHGELVKAQNRQLAGLPVYPGRDA